MCCCMKFCWSSAANLFLLTGSAAEFGGVQIGDRLVSINGINVIKAKESTVIDLVSESEFNCYKAFYNN